MNRIILIGNGFDLAHGLKTGYKDFIDKYWNEFILKVYPFYEQWMGKEYGTVKLYPYEDEFARFVLTERKQPNLGISSDCEPESPYGEFCSFINDFNENKNNLIYAELNFKNKFFEHISNQCTLVNWVDIENEYYEALKKLVIETDSTKRNNDIVRLNNEFNAVKGVLEQYLTEVSEVKVEVKESISNAFKTKINFDDIALTKMDFLAESTLSASKFLSGGYDTMDETSLKLRRKRIIKMLVNNKSEDKDITPSQTLILNFNYTKTAEELYTESGYEFINIHGELNSRDNPIIFGYGDELDDDYKTIEKLQNNDFLENIKSINYHKTGNYKKLLGYLQYEPYQVFIMGHSCGNSDRTLLNTLFEHENCVSIKVFYHQTEGKLDNYSNLIRNISRNFNDKARMRDTVVNWEGCSPLVP